MKITKQAKAKLIENALALVGSPVPTKLWSFTFTVGERGETISRTAAAKDHADAETLLRRMFNVGDVKSIESLGNVCVRSENSSALYL